MRKIAIYIVLIAILISTTACGAKQKMEEKIAEKIVETAVGADVDIDGEEVTVKGENGEEVSIGSSEWPSSDFAKKLPEFKKGKITNAVSSEDYVMITVEEVEKQDFIDYYMEIIKSFTMDNNVQKALNSLAYTGNNAEGITMSIVYNVDEKSVNISGGKIESPDDGTKGFDNDAAYLSDVRFGELKWSVPEFAKKLPEFNGGKIDSISSYKNNINIIIKDVEEKDYDNYFQNVKKTFTQDSFDMKNSDSATFYGSDEEGFGITMSYTYNDKTFSISATQN